MASSKVKVVVRCRPLLPRETVGSNGQRTTSSLRVDPSHRQVLLGDGKGYNFDHVYDQSCSQEHIYDSCVRILVEGCFNGYNATVLAYGQTGSGKTHTMGSAPSHGVGESDEEGIIPRAVRHIFHLMRTDHASKVINVKVSFLEIYNEEIRDLLHADVSPRDIALREDSEGRIFFTGAREEVCNSAVDVFRCLERGAVGRTTAETWMNDASSRSHAIFTVCIDACDTAVTTEESGMRSVGKYIQSKLHLVDLAGSERAKKTGAVGLRLKESVGINQGLMSLGKVIRALTAPASRGAAGAGGVVLSNGPAASHVPYRESKLTRFLQDSLGGNSQTVMLACVTPADSSFHETVSTLQYAARARMVQNKVVANVTLAPAPEVEEGLVTALRAQLLQAQGDLEEARKNADVAGLMLHMRCSLDDGSVLERSIDRGRPGVIKDAHWHLVAALIDGVRQCEARLTEGVTDAETFLALTQGAGTDDADVEVLGQLKDLVAVASRCTAGLNALHSVDATNEVVKVAKSMALGSAKGKVSDEKMNTTQLAAEKDLEIMRLRGELEECRDDLRRDEEIFAEKMKELKKSKKEVKRMTTENVSLKMAAQSAQDALRAELDRHAIEAAARPLKSPRDSLDGGLGRVGMNDEQDMSFAVAACEPDLSQLMEDLEVLSKEKDDLLVEKEAADERVRAITEAAESEKMQFIESKEQMQRRLKELEVGMKLKQEVISSLARKQQEASDLAEKYESRVEELQSVMGRLTHEIRRLADRGADVAEAKTSASPVSAHRSRQRNSALRKSEQEEKKVYYEEQLQLAQNQLAELERQRANLGSGGRSPARSHQASTTSKAADGKPVLAAEDTAYLRKELDSMRQEYTELTKLIEVEDTKQKKILEDLKSQLELHRKNASDYQKKIKKLEKLNLKYQQNMDVSQLKKLQEHQHALLTGTADRPGTSADHAGYTRRFKTSGGSTPGKPSARARPTSAPTANSNSGSKPAAQSTKWLECKVDELVRLRLEQAELSQCHDKLSELKSERLTLLSDIEAIRRQQNDGGVNINKQLVEVDKKIVEINDQIAEDRGHLENYHRQSTGNSTDEEERAEEELRILTKISEAQRAVRSYQERQRELKARLESGVLTEVALAKLNDLQDNLDAMNAEISFYVNRVAGNQKLNSVNPWSTNSSKAQDSEIGSRDTDRSKTDALFAELQRMDEATSTRLLLFLTHQMIDTKFRFAKDENIAMQLKNQVDECNVERDKLSEALKRSNLEFASKLDAQKLESDNKVAFLVQQLRTAEAKLKNQACSGPMSKSVSGSVVPGNSDVISPSSRAFSVMFDTAESAVAETINRPSTAGASAAWASVTSRTRPLGEAAWRNDEPMRISGTSVSEISRRMAINKESSRNLAEKDMVLIKTYDSVATVSKDIIGVPTAVAHHQAVSQYTDEEEQLKRKWLAEKQRREQLEKRNMELTRELRNLKKNDPNK